MIDYQACPGAECDAGYVGYAGYAGYGGYASYAGYVGYVGDGTALFYIKYFVYAADDAPFSFERRHLCVV